MIGGDLISVGPIRVPPLWNGGSGSAWCEDQAGYDSRDVIDHVVYPWRALSARRGEKHSLQRRQRAPWHLIFCFLSLRTRDISAFSLFAYSSLLMFVGLAKGNQFLLLATKMKKKEKEKKEKEEDGGEDGRRIGERSCFPAILALLSS